MHYERNWDRLTEHPLSKVIKKFRDFEDLKDLQRMPL